MSTERLSLYCVKIMRKYKYIMFLAIFTHPVMDRSPDAKRARPIRLTEESAPKAPEPTTNENEPIAVPQVKIGADGNIVLNEER